MRSRAPAHAGPEWLDASAGAPCPVCGAAGGCSVLEDGSFVRCFAVVSCWPVVDGGWLHAVGQAIPRDGPTG
jgi:hypothetical protein